MPFSPPAEDEIVKEGFTPPSPDDIVVTDLQAAPDDFQMAPDRNLPVPDRGGSSDTEMAGAYSRGANLSVGGILQGMAELGTPKPPLPSEQVDWLGRTKTGEPPSLEQKAREEGESRAQYLKKVQQDPLYTGGEYIRQTGQQMPEPKGVLEKGAEMAGGFTAAALSGPAAPLTMAAQSYGDTFAEQMASGKEKGLSDEEALRQAMNSAQASGVTQAAIWEFLPGPLKTLVGKLTGKIGGGAIAQFLTRRAGAAAEGAALGTVSTATQNVVTGQPVATNLGPAAGGMAAMSALLGGGRNPDVPIPETVRSAAKVMPEAAKAAEEAISEQPTTTEVPNASGKQAATAVHGDVQSQQVEGQGQVPVEEGGQGVQPSGQTGQGQVPLTIADEASKLSAMPAADFNAEIKTRKGGLTGDAYRLGLAVKTQADLKALSDGQAAAKAEGTAAKVKGDFNTALASAMRGQYFREAYEAATGTASAGEALRKADPNYQPPFPEGKEAIPVEKQKGKEEEKGVLTPQQRLAELENISPDKMTPEQEAEYHDLIERGVAAAPAAKPPLLAARTMETTAKLGRKPPVVDQPVNNPNVPIPEKSPGKPGRKPSTRPPDLIDHIIENIGSILNKRNMRAGHEGYYSSGYQQASAGYKPAAGEKPLFSDTGSAPDEIVQNLRDAGKVGEDFTVDDLWDAIVRDRNVRKQHAQGLTPEQQQDRFHTDLSANEKSPRAYDVVISDQQVGDKFQMRGNDFVITGKDKKTGEVIVKDGPKIGTQAIPEGAPVPIDKGTFKAGNVPIPPKLTILPKPETADTGEIEAQNKSAEQAATEQTTPPLQEGEREVGPQDSFGGAVPSELQLGQGRATSNKNAQVDADRAERGLPPMMNALRQAWGDVWTNVMAKLDMDWTWPDRLIQELQDKPRALTAEENLALLHRRVDWKNELEKSMREGLLAYDDGRLDAVQEAKMRTAEWSDKLSELEKVTKVAGTESGRSLAARKMMMFEDYSLASLTMEKRMANGGRQLTDAENKEIKELSEKLQKSEKALQDHIAQTAERVSKLEADKKLAEWNAELAKSGSAINPAVQRIVDRVGVALNSAADAARARIKARGASLFAGVDPTVLADVAIIGADHLFKGATELAGWSARMVKEFGEAIKPHLDELWAESNKVFDQQVDAMAGKKSKAAKKQVKDAGERAADIVSKISDRMQDMKAQGSGDMGDLGAMIQMLARTFVERGVNDREKLIDQVHAVLKDIAPEMTRRDTMDAISGYGDYKQLSKDAVSVQLRGLKGEMQQVAKLEDMRQGQPPSKTGVERRAPTDEERRLLKQVNDAKKKFAVPVTDPTRQLKSALDEIKTRFRNQIADLDLQIASGKKLERETTPVTLDKEAEALKAQRDKLKEQFDSVFGKKELTDEQRVKLATAALERSIADLETRIKNKDIAPKDRGSKTPSTPELEALRARRDALQEQMQELRDIANPKKTAEERSLQALKTRMRNSIAALTDKLARKDFTRTPRKSVTLDPEGLRLRAENEKLRQEWQNGLTKDRLRQRNPWEKTMDTLVKWRRGFILSGPVTLAKLTSAALARGVITPIEEVAGGVLSRLPGISQVSAKAPRQGGGLNVQAEAKAITEGLTKGMADAWKTLKTGQSDLDRVFGVERVEPQSFIDIFGNIHGALKAPIKRAEFARSFEKRAAALARQGVDITEDTVQMGIGAEAYLDANRAVFMQKNIINDVYKRGLSRLDQPEKTTGKPSLAGKTLGTAARVLLPIVKVPTNIVGETMEYAVGSVTGSARLARAFHRGIDTLKPEEADLIMRHLKKGSIGGAAVLLGFLAPAVFGGFYQPGQKRKPKDIKPDAARVDGVDIPPSLIHNPFVTAAQLGATIRRVSDSKLRKSDRQVQGLSHGAMAGAIGLADATPFVREMTEISKLMNPSERDQWLGEMTKSMAVPQLVQSFAAYQDKDKNGNPIARKPKGFVQAVQAGIPGLREKLKRKPGPSAAVPVPP